MVPCNVAFDPDTGKVLIRMPEGDGDDVVLAELDVSVNKADEDRIDKRVQASETPFDADR